MNRRGIAKDVPDEELNRRVMKALVKELGPADALRFIRSLARGKGNYTRDRHKWLDKLTVAQIDADIAQMQRGRKKAS